MKKLDAALLPDFKTWTAPPLPSEIPHGDMPGDKVHIGDDHIAKANRVFPALLEKAEAVLQQNPFGRCVVTVSVSSCAAVMLPGRCCGPPLCYLTTSHKPGLGVTPSAGTTTRTASRCTTTPNACASSVKVASGD